MIMVSGLEAATSSDILQGTRLQTVPSNGILLFEMQAADNVAANSYAATIQLPNGENPLNGVLIPAGATAGLVGVIDDRLALRLRFNIRQGGHCVFSVVEVGDTEVYWRVTFTPTSSGMRPPPTIMPLPR